MGAGEEAGSCWPELAEVVVVVAAAVAAGAAEVAAVVAAAGAAAVVAAVVAAGAAEVVAVVVVVAAEAAVPRTLGLGLSEGAGAGQVRRLRKHLLRLGGWPSQDDGRFGRRLTCCCREDGCFSGPG